MIKVNGKIDKLLGRPIIEAKLDIRTIPDKTLTSFQEAEDELLSIIASKLSKHFLVEITPGTIVVPNMNSLNPIIDIFYEEGWDLIELYEGYTYFSGPYILRWQGDEFTYAGVEMQTYVPVAYISELSNIARITTFRYNLGD